RAPVVERSLDEVLARIRTCGLPDQVREWAERLFIRMDQAERAIHGGKAHFHEVGADDAIADVVGVAAAFHSLSPEEVVILPVALGSGTVEGMHGTYPLPAPATLALLQDSGIPARLNGEEGELCTPTGAAILAELATRGDLPDLPVQISAIGYGAGSRNPPDRPNVLRAMLLSPAGEGRGDMVDILETNVDDITGEVLAAALASLMDAGARDASAVPLMMKKGRWGYLVRVISSPADTVRLSKILMIETGTLGVRVTPAVHRLTVARSVETVNIRAKGCECCVRVKIATLEGELVSVKAEYEDALECARRCSLPLREVQRIAEYAWRERATQAREE
ncbi:MAG: nickel pincer cofactor biosynthesis protein LarC, partial [Methanomicrobiaceae archaeon]|nr:nickel pincer cofactor biosynthesis protein LarC [Methanomicrobiaceae archaeon]